MAKEVIELLEDFSGGLNTRFAPNRIEPPASPTTTNTWYDTRALKKRNGATISTFNASLPGGVGSTAFRGYQIANYTDATSANGLFIYSSIAAIASNNAFVYTTNVSTGN